MTARSTRTTLLLVLLGGLLVFVLVAYLVVAPFLLAGMYKDSAVDAHNAVAEKTTALSEQYTRPAFTKVDVTPAVATADFAATRKVLEEARSELDRHKTDLTGFVKLPGMGLNGTYADATTASEGTEQWVAKSEQLFAAADADLTYFEKSNAVAGKYENIGKSLESLTGNESPEQIAQTVDRAASELEALTGEYKQLQPTESLKKNHETGVMLTQRMVSQLRELGAAFRAGDAGRLDAVSTQINTTISEVGTYAAQSVADYARDSQVAKLTAELNVLDSRLEADFARI